MDPPVSSIARIVRINKDSVWRILKHYLYETRKAHDFYDILVLGIDRFSVEEHYVYVTLFYDIEISRVIRNKGGFQESV